MDFKFNVENMLGAVEMMKIDKTLTAKGHENDVDFQNKMRLVIDEMGKVSAISQELKSPITSADTYNLCFQNKMRLVIDEMGKVSAISQELKSPITSADKLVHSDHMLYMMTESNTSGHFAVVGILKMGWKKLYLYDKMASRSEAMVYCLLDFYVHETRQRKGYGKFLMDYMLQDVNLCAKNLAIDKPTKKLVQFMWKHYQLSKLVNQGNNFVIYEEFFHDAFEEKNSENTENRSSKYKCQEPSFGRHGAQKQHDTMGEIVQGEGDSAFVKFKYNHDTDFADNQFKEVNSHGGNLGGFHTDADGHLVKRDLKFHHNSIW